MEKSSPDLTAADAEVKKQRSLDRARREWLEGLSRAHTTSPSARSALEYAQGLWRCGEYQSAFRLFIEARDRAPEQPGCHLALLHAATMMSYRDAEREALSTAVATHPSDPGVALHAARAEVPGNMEQARSRLAKFPDDPTCTAFLQAVEVIMGLRDLNDLKGFSQVPDMEWRLSGFRWVHDRAGRTDVHQGLPTRVLEQALAGAKLSGLVMECGVYFGRSLDIIARHLDQPVHGFDSFEGLPEAWKSGEGAGSYSTAGRLPWVANHVALHPGWFEQTLPPFLDAHPGPIRLLHIDCDIYSSTRTVLDAVGGRLQPGSVIVFDDMLGYPGYEAHELRAFEEFVQKSGMRWELLAACLMGREVAVRITGR